MNFCLRRYPRHNRFPVFSAYENPFRRQVVYLDDSMSRAGSGVDKVAGELGLRDAFLAEVYYVSELYQPHFTSTLDQSAQTLTYNA